MPLERPWLDRANQTYSSPLFLAAIRAGGILGTMAITLLAASLLSAREFGRLAVLLALAQVVAIPLASLQAPVLRTVANADEPTGLFRGTVAVVGRHATVQLLLGGVVALVVSRLLDVPAGQGLAVLALGIVLGAMQAVQAARRGVGDFLFGQAPFEMVRPVLACLLLLAALLSLDRTATTAFNAIIAATVASAGCFLLLSGLDRGHAQDPGIGPTTVGWFVLATVGTSFIGRIEVIMVGLLLSSRQAGDLALALRFGQLGAFGISLAGFRFAGDLSAHFARSDRHAVQRVINKVTALGLAVGVPVGLAMVLAPGLLLGPFGPVTSERTAATVVVGLALLVNTAFGPTMMVMTMTGLERQAAYGQLAGATTAIVVSVMAGGTALAGAIGYACAISLWNGLFAVQLSRRFDLSTSVLGLLSAGRGGPKTAAVEVSIR